jgi:ribosomal protein L16/L10AE
MLYLLAALLEAARQILARRINRETGIQAVWLEWIE